MTILKYRLRVCILPRCLHPSVKTKRMALWTINHYSKLSSSISRESLDLKWILQATWRMYVGSIEVLQFATSIRAVFRRSKGSGASSLIFAFCSGVDSKNLDPAPPPLLPVHQCLDSCTEKKLGFRKPNRTLYQQARRYNIAFKQPKSGEVTPFIVAPCHHFSSHTTMYRVE